MPPQSDAPVPTDPPGGDYDLLPYLSLPLALTQPSHMGALAALYGFLAPAAGTARVLELGCASCGNIIPLAARFPDARFLGIDLSPRQIDLANARIALLGLTNIEARSGDITSLALGAEKFDYIICHGVFSWVPEAVRAAIFRLCQDHLTAGGMATISYNVLPGWRLRQVIRDICMRHAGSSGTPQQRVARARAALDQLAASARDTEPYGQLLRTEAKKLVRRPASYILGEFLAAENTPFLFEDFVAAAARYGLDFLCEADLHSGTPELLLASQQQDRLTSEQRADFVTGRTFRRSVLIRALRQPSSPTDYLQSLYFASSSRSADASRSPASQDAQAASVLRQLAGAYPATLPLAALTVTGSPEALHNSLRSLLFRGSAIASSVPMTMGTAAASRPSAWWLARAEAGAGQSWVSSLRHTPVPLPRLAAMLLCLLDGTRGRAELAGLVENAIQGGEITLPELAGAAPAQYVEEKLAFFATKFLLEPD